MKKIIITATLLLSIPLISFAASYGSIQSPYQISSSTPTAGFVLQTDGSKNNWVATSSLGLSVSNFADTWTRIIGGIYAGDSLASTSETVGIGSTTAKAVLAIQASSTGNNTVPELSVASSTGSTTFSVLPSGSVCVGTNNCTDAFVVSNVTIPRITLGPGTGVNNDATYNIRSVGTGNAYVSLTKNAVADEFHYGWNGTNSNYEFGTGGTMGSNIDQTVTTGGLFNFLTRVGFGSTTPGTTVAIQAATNITPLSIASSTGATLVKVGGNGEITVGGATPTVSSCGTGAAVQTGSTDVSGIIAIGTGVTTSCTITWGGPKNGRNIMIFANAIGSLGQAVSIATSTTGFVATFSANSASGAFEYFTVSD